MEMYRSTDVLDNPPTRVMIKRRDPKRKILFLASILLCVVGLGALTATTALLLTKDNENEQNEQSRCDETKQHEKARELYKKIKNKYEELHPDAALVQNPLGRFSSIHPLFLNFTPALYKARTEAAKKLLKELEDLGGTIVMSKEENQTFEVFRRFLVNTFGTPYENNYETGDWLLGPNIFCWQESCSILHALVGALRQITPRTVKDIELMVDLMKRCSEGYKQRIRNLKYGISAGIVLSDVACRAGLENFKKMHVHVAKNGKKGIFSEHPIASLSLSIVENVVDGEKIKWRKKYKVSMKQFLKDSMLNYVGKPLNDFLRYLKDDYSTHCPPSGISSGFASLPLPYVYTNGVRNVSRPTTGSLPGGEKFNGSSSYLILLSHFTTYEITPQEVDRFADERLKLFFPQVVKIAKSRTKEDNDSKAIEEFRVQLESDEFYYSVEKNATHSEPHTKCYDEETAQKYCPERWKAMNRWLQSTRGIINELRTKMGSAFYMSGENTDLKQIMPTCPVKMGFDFMPANPYHSYGEGSVDCSHLAKISIPFFLERLGPKYEERTVMAHEAYPGHHLEVQGVKEHFEIKCDKLREWVSNMNYFAAFSEGWATYIERDVADEDMKLYENDMQRYGMLKHQILAALRAKVDVGLHFLGMKRRDAVALYEKYALDISDGIQKEITRLQSAPGQGTAYMVGEAKFSEYRRNTKAKLGEKFDVRDFHYEILRQGELPILDVGKHIDEYIERELNKE